MATPLIGKVNNRTDTFSMQSARGCHVTKKRNLESRNSRKSDVTGGDIPDRGPDVTGPQGTAERSGVKLNICTQNGGQQENGNADVQQ